MAQNRIADPRPQGDIEEQTIVQPAKQRKSRPVTSGPIPDAERAHQKTKAAENRLFNKHRAHARRVALADRLLTGTQKSITSLMIDRLNPANDWAWQTVRSIARHLGTGKNVVMETFSRLEGWLFLFERRHPQGNTKYNPIAHWRLPKNILDVRPRDEEGTPLENWDSDFGFARKRVESGPERGTSCTPNEGQSVPETGDKGVPETGDYNDRQPVTIGNECLVSEQASPSISPASDDGELFHDGKIKITNSKFNSWRNKYPHWYGEDFQRVFRSIDNWLSDDSDRKIGNAGIHRWLKREYESDENVLSSRQIDAAIRSETAAERDERQRKYVIRQEIAAPGMWGRPEDISEQFVEKTLADWRKMLSELDWRQALMGFHADTNSWREEWGPSPRDSRCLAPRELMVEYGFAPAFQRGCISLSTSELAEAKHDFQHTNVEAELVGMEPRISRLPRHKDQKAAIWAALAKIDREAAEHKAVIAEKDARGPWSPNYRGDGRI